MMLSHLTKENQLKYVAGQPRKICVSKQIEDIDACEYYITIDEQKGIEIGKMTIPNREIYTMAFSWEEVDKMF